MALPDTHDWIKSHKHGYGKVTDHVSREIRHGRISRDLGQKLINHFQNKQPIHQELLLDWIGINKESLDFILKSETNIQINETPKPLTDSEVKSIREIFYASSTLTRGKDLNQIIIGKGYP